MYSVELEYSVIFKKSKNVLFSVPTYPGSFIAELNFASCNIT